MSTINKKSIFEDNNQQFKNKQKMEVSTHTLKINSLMEKQTAVEWLFKQLWEEPKDKFTWNTILSKAKEMEREQIIDAYIEASENPALILEDAEDYYNETFKNKEI